MEKRRCKNQNCRRTFKVSPRHPNQEYCSAKKCQGVRKMKWYRKKMSTDEAYRKNQADCQKKWRERHPQYWKNYRKKNERYTKKNRAKQRERNKANRSRKSTASIFKPIANIDASKQKNSIISGMYKLIPVGRKIANIDALIVEINEITAGYG